MAAAILSSAVPDVGMRLLLCPLGANIVTRTACCTAGIVFPVYSTFKAIEKKDQSDQEKWLLYWAAYGTFSLAEVFSDKILSWFPLYYHMKFAFLVWLQVPSCNTKFAIKHQREIEFLKALLKKCAHTANLMRTEMAQPVPPAGRNTVEGRNGPTRPRIQDPGSDAGN